MNAAFQRKVAYLALIAALLVPLAMVSRPATIAVGDDPGSSGGKLAQLRESLKLGQAQMGEIDPTSSAARYLSFGMHGVAICILNEQAVELQRQEDWISLSAVLNQQTYLQPYYVKVWTHQAWNVSYNISSQWDDFRDKYYWVVRGFKLLSQGMGFNEQEPRFPYELGWAVGHKIGQADEWREYRTLFARDDELHREPWAAWVDRRDSWLFGKRYLETAAGMVDQGAPLRSMGLEMFHLQVPIAQVKFAETIEREGTFGDKARNAWSTGLDDFRAFGRREFPSEEGFFFRIDDLPADRKRLDEMVARLETQLAPGARTAIVAEKRARLPADWLKALDVPPDRRSEQERRMAQDAEYNTFVSDAETAERAPDDRRDEARRTARDLKHLRARVRAEKSARETFNFDYWIDRSQMEASDEALAARQLYFEAVRTADDDPWTARKAFDDAFAKWRIILDRFPAMKSDQTSYDVNDYILTYRRVLKQLDAPFDPQKFILRDLLRRADGTTF